MENKPLVDRGEYGSPIAHDPDWQGQNRSRRCHDILFAITFIVVLVASSGISVVSFSKGDPSALIPDVVVAGNHVVNVTGRTQSAIQNAMALLKDDTVPMIASLALALVTGFVWIQLLRCFTKGFIYITFALGLAMVSGLGLYLFFSGETGLRYGSYAVFAIVVIMLLAIIFIRKKVALTAALMKESVTGVNHSTPSIYIASVIIILLLVAYYAFWTSSMLYLYSIPSGDSGSEMGGSAVAGSGSSSTPLVAFESNVRYLILFQIFVLFWVSTFISAVYQMTVAGSVSTWYYSRGHDSPLGNATFKTMMYAFTFSFGSLALGSLIIAIFRFINYMLERVKRANKNNKLIACVICLLQCCLACVRKTIEYLSKFAYIYMGIHGDSFCGSAKSVFHLLSRQAANLIMVDMIGTWVVFIGKLCGTALCVFVTVIAANTAEHPISLITILVVAALTFLVFEIYAHVVTTGLDTVLVCYLEDLERNSENGRYVCSAEMHNMIAAHKERKTVN